MNKMIERHARAYNPIGWAWYDRTEDNHPAKPIFFEREEKQSRAAIGAMREPTKEMTRAAINNSASGAAEEENVWRSMVDAALR